MAPKALQAKALYEFGAFRLDVSQRVLLCEGELIPLAPKAFDTLLTLVESQGRVMAKEDLLKGVWPDTFIEEGSLVQNISILRKALGGGANGQQYIQTIPKRGYRFVPPVRLAEDVTSPEAPSDPGLQGNPSGNWSGAAASKYGKYVLATAAAVAVVAAILIWERWETKPLTDQDVLVLADFTNSTGDPVFDGTLREALAFQIEQSPFLKVLDDQVMREDLQLMTRSPRERITNDLAHDICVREADKALLAGSIANLGKTFVIELKATNCRDGATLARQQAEAADKEHVLQAVATAAQRIRANLGESLSSIEKLAPPPGALRVTTASLEAFQAFATGEDLFQESRFPEAIPFLQRATELDPDLAFAWEWLGVAYLNAGDSTRAQEYANRALALRDRVSAYERFWLGGSGFTSAGQSDKARENHESWARTYPRDPAPVVMLALDHRRAGEFEEALSMWLKAQRLAPRRKLYPSGVMGAYIRLDRFAEAQAVAERAFAQGLDNPNVHQELLAIAYAQGDQEGAAKQIQWFVGKPEEYLNIVDQAAQARTLGQLRKSRDLLQHAADLARRQNLPDAAAHLLDPDAAGDALLGDCRTARKTNAVSPETLALCGNVELAERSERLNAQTAKEHSTDTLWNAARLPLLLGAEELGLGHPAHAIELLQSVMPYERAYPFSNYVRGLAYLRLNKGTEAAAEFQKLLDHRGANWGRIYPLSYVGLARAAALAGNKARADQAYRVFFDLWKDADTDVPFLIQARKEYARLNQ
jgi:DNA-binding winged helix-turn-helix (wHTH) protein/tetratricopeptide (TPR) repeat protein